MNCLTSEAIVDKSILKCTLLSSASVHKVFRFVETTVINLPFQFSSSGSVISEAEECLSRDRRYTEDGRLTCKSNILQPRSKENLDFVPITEEKI